MNLLLNETLIQLLAAFAPGGFTSWTLRSQTTQCSLSKIYPLVGGCVWPSCNLPRAKRTGGVSEPSERSAQVSQFSLHPGAPPCSTLSFPARQGYADDTACIREGLMIASWGCLHNKVLCSLGCLFLFSCADLLTTVSGEWEEIVFRYLLEQAEICTAPWRWSCWGFPVWNLC